jgi:hypothetical protein
VCDEDEQENAEDHSPHDGAIHDRDIVAMVHCVQVGTGPRIAGAWDLSSKVAPMIGVISTLDDFVGAMAGRQHLGQSAPLKGIRQSEGAS